MKRYCIKSGRDGTAYFDIIRETEDGFVIRITKYLDGYEKIVDETMTRHLFEMCLKTGYICQAEAEAPGGRKAIVA